MKKILLIMLPILIITVGIAYAIVRNNQPQYQGGLMDNKEKRILVAFFSYSGNTKFIAEKIHKQVGGDIFSIEPVTPYPADYNETAYGIAKEQRDKNIHPAIKLTGDISGYDVIFVGTPAWWYTMTPPIMTFLEKNNFEGKTIIPFITHGGGGKYNIAEEVEKLAKGAKVLAPFVVYGRGNSETDKELADWLKKL